MKGEVTMPTYEYRCNACHVDFETEKRMSEPVETACPACGSDLTNRLISHSSFVLKGSGWYVTDYARKNGKGGGGETHGRQEGDARKDAPDAPPAATPASAGTASESSTTAAANTATTPAAAPAQASSAASTSATSHQNSV